MVNELGFPLADLVDMDVDVDLETSGADERGGFAPYEQGGKRKP